MWSYDVLQMLLKFSVHCKVREPEKNGCVSLMASNLEELERVFSVWMVFPTVNEMIRGEGPRNKASFGNVKRKIRYLHF